MPLDDSGTQGRSRGRLLITLGLGLVVAASVVALRSGTRGDAPRAAAVEGRGVAVAAEAARARPHRDEPALEPQAEETPEPELDSKPVAAEPRATAAPLLPDPARFESPEQERQVLVERLPGERLTLENQGKAVERMERVLGSATSVDVVELERLRERKERLKAKYELQAQRVAGLEQRIGEVSPK
jgi:hypothetical protein